MTAKREEEYSRAGLHLDDSGSEDEDDGEMNFGKAMEKTIVFDVKYYERKKLKVQKGSAARFAQSE